MWVLQNGNVGPAEEGTASHHDPWFAAVAERSPPFTRSYSEHHMFVTTYDLYGIKSPGTASPAQVKSARPFGQIKVDPKDWVDR